MIAATSIVPSIAQKIALRFSPAPKYPAAALKQRIALVHPLAQAAGAQHSKDLHGAYGIELASAS